MTSSIIISITSLGLCIIGFIFFRRYIARKTSASTLLADYREEVYRLIAEIDAATDRDSLLVEERIKTLRKLIDDTDRRISVYIRELQRSQDGQAMYDSLGKGIRIALEPRPPLLDQLSAQEAPSAAPAAPGNGENPPEKPSPKKHKPKKNNATQPSKPNIKAKIAQMSAQGIAPTEIASRLGISIAEVDLTLSLLHIGDRG